MKVSQRTEYGLRAMVALAGRFDNGLMSIKELAEQEDIPVAFLEQIMSELRRADLIASTRGAYGGYTLSKAPNKISAGQVISTLEGSLSPARCGSNCDKMSGCSTRSVLKRIEDSITDTLDNIFLNELVKVGVDE